VTISVTPVRVLATVVALGAALILSGCSSNSPANTTDAPSPGYTSTYQTPAPPVVAPLRGTVVPAASVSGPALSVKICNLEHCEPQIGLNHADVVFEELVEGGITRYVAVWQSDVPDVVGPVRSVRPMDPDIVSSFGGIVAYSGWGPEEVHQMILGTGLVNVTESTEGMYRLPDRVAPYNLALRARDVIAANPGLAAPQQQFAYSSDLATSTAALDGAAASTLSLVFSQASENAWTYDAGSGHYLRSQWGGPDLDEAGAQLNATNVAVMRVNVEDFMNLPKTVMIGSGEAWVAAGGKVVHGTWTKTAATSPIHFTDDRGVTVRMAPGNTWIEMVPNNGGFVSVTP
jgi:hypothetical protein